jgi:hypothetical protein
LTKCFCSDNKTGDEGAKELAKALKVNTSLAEIYLSNNNIGVEGKRVLEEAGAVNGCSVDVLYNGCDLLF